MQPKLHKAQSQMFVPRYAITGRAVSANVIARPANSTLVSAQVPSAMVSQSQGRGEAVAEDRVNAHPRCAYQNILATDDILRRRSMFYLPSRKQPAQTHENGRKRIDHHIFLFTKVRWCNKHIYTHELTLAIQLFPHYFLISIGHEWSSSPVGVPGRLSYSLPTCPKERISISDAGHPRPQEVSFQLWP
jgi:hypothetical protein